MKLNYKAKIIIASVLIVLFFLILNLTPLGKEVKNFFYLTSSPIQKIFWEAGNRTSGFFEFIIQMKYLKRENEELKLKVQDLLVKNNALEELKKENEMLREALDIGLEKEFQLVLSQVTGKPPLQDVILIDKGTHDGISKDLPVITQQKVLIGRVGEVYKNFSKIILISHSQSSFDGKVPTPSRAEDSGAGTDSEILGIVKGRGNLGVIFDRIPGEEEVKEGDQVVTSALGGFFPSGLLVGKISRIIKADPEPFYWAELSPYFNIGELEKVFIILD